MIYSPRRISVAVKGQPHIQFFGKLDLDCLELASPDLTAGKEVKERVHLQGNDQRVGDEPAGPASEQASVRPITEKDIKELIAKASPIEAKYLLLIETQNRPGQSFTEVQDYEIILGEVETIELQRYYSYPHFDVSKVLIIPRTIPVIVHTYHYWDFGPSDVGEEHAFHVFTQDGWKVIQIY